MKLKELEGLLGDLEDFVQPKVELEQYATRPHIAARILHTIHSHFDDLDGRVVLDLGCGSGVFLIGASLLGAGSCIGVDIDASALEICSRNCRQFEVDNVDLMCSDAASWFPRAADDRGRPPLVDVVITNPPFGTKNNQGVDMMFLRRALAVAGTAVYSLHKTSTRDHIVKKAAEWKVKMEVLAELRFDLPATYTFHRRKCVDVAVDFIRFSQMNREVVSSSR